MMLNAHGVIELVTPLGGPEVPKVLESLGVKDLDRVVGVTGLDKEEMVSRSLVSFKGDPKGMFQLFEQKPLTTADLDLIPNNATFAFALKLDAGKAWATILDIVEKIDPKAKEKLLQNRAIRAGSCSMKPSRRWAMSGAYSIRRPRADCSLERPRWCRSRMPTRRPPFRRS